MKVHIAIESRFLMWNKSEKDLDLFANSTGQFDVLIYLIDSHLIKPTTSAIAHLLNMIWTSPQKMKQQIV